MTATALSLLAAAHAEARTLKVGPGARYAKPCAAIAAARAGDTIAIDARGRYRGDVCRWATDRLRIVGVRGRPHIDAAGANSGGKGTWVIAGDHTTVQRVRLSGSRVPDRNGAGIRLEGRGLRVLDSVFDRNENGILTGAIPGSDVVIERSRFVGGGAGDGFSHNLYIGDVRSLTFRDSVSIGARVGHLLKSRARVNRILGACLDSTTGTASYELDLPNGGRSLVWRTTIIQGARSENAAVIAFGEEGDLHPRSQLTVRESSIADRLGRGTAVLVGPLVTAATRLEQDRVARTLTLTNQRSARRSRVARTGAPLRCR